MGKTLLRPTISTEKDLATVRKEDNNKSLDELMEEMNPFLEKASLQLIQPDEQVISELLKKISG
ncbi:MAG TPA: hypothetical protein VL098_05150 [Flavipsychrobacter sp.]|nr:hypothetical protein [Flavipsychrobacter sp.]